MSESLTHPCLMKNIKAAIGSLPLHAKLIYISLRILRKKKAETFLVSENTGAYSFTNCPIVYNKADFT